MKREEKRREGKEREEKGREGILKNKDRRKEGMVTESSFLESYHF